GGAHRPALPPPRTPRGATNGQRSQLPLAQVPRRLPIAVPPAEPGRKKLARLFLGNARRIGLPAPTPCRTCRTQCRAMDVVRGRAEGADPTEQEGRFSGCAGAAAPTRSPALGALP